MTSWQDSLESIYASDIAVDATLSNGSGDPLAVRVIDKTEGVVVVGENNPEIQTIIPIAVITMAQLTAGGISPDDEIDGQTLTIDGKAWTVSSHRYKPTPDGEKKGELILLLKDGEI